MKKSILKRVFALLLAASCLFGICACSSGESQRKDITKEALEYFNRGISAFNIASCLSVCRAYAVVEEKDNPTNKGGYLLYFENLYHNNGSNPQRMTVTYQALTKNPAAATPAEMNKISTSYLLDGWIYYNEEKGKKFKLPIEQDYSSAIGLYSLGNATPGGSYGIIEDGVIRADLYFSPNQCKKTQTAFLQNMNTVIFGAQQPEVSYSNMILTSFMDEKTNRFSSYEISFTGSCTVGEKSYTVRYFFTENFVNYGTKNEIAFPEDLSSYERAK